MQIQVILKSQDKQTMGSLLKKNHFSDSLISSMKKEHTIQVNDIVDKNQKVTITLPKENSSINLVKGNLDIVYEDDYLLILNKPHGIAVIGTKAHYDYHLSGQIMSYYKKIKLNSTVHFVNRLDLDTSGLIIVAKHQYIHALLADSDIEKKYRLLVEGKLENKKGTLSYQISKSDTGRNIKREINDNGKESITEYVVKKINKDTSEIEAKLITGRTHQLRLHFAASKHPIIGDSLYGAKKDYLHLQSYYLKFKHPITKKVLLFKLNKEW